jgi:hypothetical protein
MSMSSKLASSCPGALIVTEVCDQDDEVDTRLNSKDCLEEDSEYSSLMTQK